MPRPHELSSHDEAAVRAIASRCLPRLASIERVPSVHNIVCRLRLSDGRRRVLKLAKSNVASPGLVREPGVYALLHRHGLPVPRLDCEDLHGQVIGRPWFIAEDAGRRSAGDPSGLSSTNRRALYRRVGRLLASVHELTFDRPADFAGAGLVPATFDRSPMQAWHQRQLHEAQRLGLLGNDRSGDALLPRSALSAAADALATLPQTTGYALCHGDFNPNQCVRRGPNVTALVDWEAAHIGDPAYDFAAFEVMLRVTVPRDLADAAIEGYRERHPISPALEEAYRPVRIAHAAALAVTFKKGRRHGPLRAARAFLGQAVAEAPLAA